MIKRFFILMVVSCTLLVGCSSNTTKEPTTIPECDVCHQINSSYDWRLVSVGVPRINYYWYECRYCGNVIYTKQPIIRECFSK